jgi:hypothetical protein
MIDSHRVSRYGARLLIAASIFLFQGCSEFGSLMQPVSTRSIPARHFLFRDGAQAIYFSFEKNLRQGIVANPASHVETYLFVVAGSGCSSMRHFLPGYFRGLEGESGRIRIFILQKRHIEEGSWGRFLGCGEDFIRDDHPGRWIADQSEFIEAQLEIAKNGAMPKRIVLAGISEGGDVVPVLAQRIHGVTHLVIVGSGGMNPLDAYRLQAKKHGFEVQLSALAALESPPPADPDDPWSLIAGRSWRYWFELSQLRQSDNLLALSIPILMAMGTADRSVPIESAWHIRDRFASSGKTNLRLIAYPDADHGLQAGGVSHLPDFWHALELLLQE